MKKEVPKLIDLASKLMQSRTYRQIVKDCKVLLPDILGFDTVNVFFKDIHCYDSSAGTGDLFTLTNYDPPPRPKMAGDTNIDFAYDLYLPDDEIVIFPGNMGVTG